MGKSDGQLDLFSTGAPPPPATEPTTAPKRARRGASSITERPEDQSPSSDPATPPVWSVSGLTDRIQSLLESSIGGVRLAGEISNLRIQSSGHLYFTLKDEQAQIAAVMFRGDARRLAFRPADGDRVVLDGVITVYKPRGAYQIKVRAMQQDGRGSLQARFEALKEKLRSEGLFAPERKQPLPVFPRRLGVVTSPTGAALRDFLHVIGRRCPHVQTLVVPVRVQGDEAAGEIAAMIAELDRRAAEDPQQAVDVIVLARGGGSLEDLWAFNEEIVARAIAACSIPIVSAVGHETDFTIADFVADQRAPTPSAAAEIVALSRDEWLDRLQGSRRTLQRAVRDAVAKRREILARYRSHYAFREPVRLVEASMQRVDEARHRLKIALQRGVSHRRERLDALGRRWSRLDTLRLLEAKRRQTQSLRRQLILLSPRGVLERGYAIVFDAQGYPLRSASTTSTGDAITVQLVDAALAAKVEGPSPGRLTPP